MHAGSVITVEDKLPELFSEQQNSPSDGGTLEGQMNSTLTAAKKMSFSSDVKAIHLKNGLTPLSLKPQASLSNKSSIANCDIPRHSGDYTLSDMRLHGNLSPHVADNAPVLKHLPEEIVIGDSDDEVMEIEDSMLSRTPNSYVQHSHLNLSTKKESQAHL